LIPGWQLIIRLDTRILCEITSDLSAADEKKFVERNKNFWSMKKHYFRIEYSVRVLIGPADIRFELWFDDQKLSRDQSIKVQWTPSPAPLKMGVPGRYSDTLNTEAAELPVPRSATNDGQTFTRGADDGKMARSSFATLGQEPDRTEKKRRSMGGLLAKARNGNRIGQR
jgi:hypothetical protein